MESLLEGGVTQALGFNIWQILIIAVLILLLFGRGKISEVMGDFAKGVKSFKKGIADEETPAGTQPLRDGRTEPVATVVTEDKRNA